jgi:hypothetical protein
MVYDGPVDVLAQNTKVTNGNRFGANVLYPDPHGNMTNLAVAG